MTLFLAGFVCGALVATVVLTAWSVVNAYIWGYWSITEKGKQALEDE